MNRITRAVVLAVPALTGQLMLVAPAFADEGASKPLQTAWYWYRPTDASPIAPPSALSPASDPTTPKGGLPVAPNADGTSMKESFVAFDLSAIPATATVDSFVVTAPVIDANTKQSEVPKIIACVSARTWAPGEALAWNTKPVLDCTAAKVAGKYDDAKKTWTFELAPLASYWLQGNTGVGFKNDPEYKNKPYQVVFDAAKITAEAHWTPAVATPPTTNTPNTPNVPQPQAAPPPAPPTYTGSTSGLSSGSVGGTTYVPPVVTPPQTAPVPQVATGPQTTQVAVATRAIRVGGAAPGAGFWVLATGLAGLLVLASWVLGQAPRVEPVAVAGASRLDRALRARRTAAATRPTRTKLSVRPA